MARQRNAEAIVRLLRVGETVRHALSRIMLRQEFTDPDLAGVSVTVTQANVSSDLRNATIYVIPLGGTNEAEVIEALNRAAGFLRGRLASEVRLKYLPKLQFELDGSFNEARRIEELLASPAVKRDLEGKSD